MTAALTARRVVALVALICSLAGALSLLAPGAGVSTVASAQVPGPVRTAAVWLRPFNGSGIRGQLSVRDDGAVMTVTGTASGFVPGRQYVSLVYGLKSVPRGPTACARDDTLNFEQMALNVWRPLSGTTRTLVPARKLTVGLEQINTASIRRVEAPFTPNPFADLPPQAFFLQACGLVRPTG